MKSRYCLAIIITILAFGQAQKYLKEKPSFLRSCGMNDPGLEKCLASNFQAIFSQWKNGVPGLKTVGKWDPLLVKRVKIAQDNSRVISLNMDLQNVIVSGISKVNVQNAKLNSQNWIVNVKIVVPRLDFDSDYKVKGRVLSLPLNGQGKTQFYAENLQINLQLNCKLRTDGDYTFTEIQALRANIEKVSNFHMRVENLFNGQKELEESANALFNENWRELYESLRPVIEQTIEKTLDDRLKKIFHYVPANYFISDIPKAS